MNKIQSHVFRGRRYRIHWRRWHKDKDGGCDPPTAVGKKIMIDPKLNEAVLLAVLLDEAFHACFFDLGNEEVDQASECIAKFLWRIGFRLEKK